MEAGRVAASAPRCGPRSPPLAPPAVGADLGRASPLPPRRQAGPRPPRRTPSARCPSVNKLRAQSSEKRAGAGRLPARTPESQEERERPGTRFNSHSGHAASRPRVPSPPTGSDPHTQARVCTRARTCRHAHVCAHTGTPARAHARTHSGL